MLFLYKFHSRSEQKVSCKAAKLHADINTHTHACIWESGGNARARVIIEYLIRGRKCAVAE